MNDNAYFEVMECPVYAQRTDAGNFMDMFKPAATHKALIRKDNNEVLGIHSKAYKKLDNGIAYPLVEEAIRESGLAWDGMSVKTEMDGGGRRTLRTYTFPEHRIEIAEGDVTNLQIRVPNSYDGSWAFGIMLGGYRLVCSNGLVVGTSLARVKRKHTVNLDIHELVAQLQQAAKMYAGNEQLWRTWARTTITDNQAETILKELAGTSERGFQELQLSWWHERALTGSTAWSLYQVLTAWSTHTQARKNHATGLIQREERVRRILPQLEELAA